MDKLKMRSMDKVQENIEILLRLAETEKQPKRRFELTNMLKQKKKESVNLV